MERRGRNAVVVPLATTGSPTAAYLLVTLASLFGPFPELEAHTIEANPVGAREAETSRASNHPVIPLGLDLYLPVPEDNPLSPETVVLGRTLFFDPILSRDQRLACAGCHDPERAFTDGRALSVGVFGRVGTRSVPTLVNRAYGRSFFWDGRTSSLEDQVLQPIQDPMEMDMTLEAVAERLRRDRVYSERFQARFGRIPTYADLANTLASYVRTILSGDAPIDRYMNGERDALSAQARDGLRIFRGKGNCTACHLGSTFTDERFHNTGVAWKGLPTQPRVQSRASAVPAIVDAQDQHSTSANEEGELVDLGRFEVTGDDEDRGAFKTPTLRNVELTAPYMHDGSLASLAEVIDFYNRGGNTNPYSDPSVRPLALTAEEKQALQTFLRALTGSVREGM